jgi:hypothetical protein
MSDEIRHAVLFADNSGKIRACGSRLQPTPEARQERISAGGRMTVIRFSGIRAGRHPLEQGSRDTVPSLPAATLTIPDA